MSKTVLLPDDLYIEIQNTDVSVHWVKVEQSMAKKIKFFFEVYKIEKMIEDGEETLESFVQKNPHSKIHAWERFYPRNKVEAKELDDSLKIDFP